MLNDEHRTSNQLLIAVLFRFSGKDIILFILKGKVPFKMHKIIFFPNYKNYLKNIYVPTLPKFSDALP